MKSEVVMIKGKVYCCNRGKYANDVSWYCCDRIYDTCNDFKNVILKSTPEAWKIIWKQSASCINANNDCKNYI